MKKLLAFFTFILALVSTAIAQPNADLFKQVLKLSGNAETVFDQSPESLQQFVMLAKMGNPSLSDDEAKSKIENYMKNEFFDDVTELCLQYYKTFTDEDCQVFLLALGNEEAQATMKRINTSTAQSQKEMTSVISTALQQIQAGQKPENIALVEAPASLRARFDQYADLISLDSTVQIALDGMKQQMSSFMPAEMKQRLEESIKDVSEYMVNNIRPLTFNLMSKAVTEQDLQRYIDLYTTPAGQHMVEGNKAMSADVFNFSMAIVQKLMTRMQ